MEISQVNGEFSEERIQGRKNNTKFGLLRISSRESNSSGEGQNSTPTRSRQTQDRVLKAGAVSPSGVCITRRDSPVIKRNAGSCHELSKGREAIVMPHPSTHFSNGVRAHSNDSTNKSSNFRLNRKSRPVDRVKSDSDVKLSHLPRYMREPATLRHSAWLEPSGKSYSVRGPDYMSDGLKVNSLPSVFRLLTVDIVKVETPIMTGICTHPGERIQLALARERATGVQELPNFVFCVNLILPHTQNFHAAFYFGLEDINLIHDTSAPFGKVANRFFFGDSDEYRDETFKLIPRIVDGNYLVKRAVGSKPAILGNKIPQTYIQTGRFFEIICNIAEDKVASSIVKFTLGYAKTMSCDMAFVLEGNDSSELPEQILGAVRVINLDFKKEDGQREVEARAF